MATRVEPVPHHSHTCPQGCSKRFALCVPSVRVKVAFVPHLFKRHVESRASPSDLPSIISEDTELVYPVRAGIESPRRARYRLRCHIHILYGGSSGELVLGSPSSCKELASIHTSVRSQTSSRNRQRR